MGAKFPSRVGPCVGIVEHVPRVTTHPQMLALELRAPMGTCPGQYGNRKHKQKVVTINWEKFGLKIFLLILLTT